MALSEAKPEVVAHQTVEQLVRSAKRLERQIVLTRWGLGVVFLCFLLPLLYQATNGFSSHLLPQIVVLLLAVVVVFALSNPLKSLEVGREHLMQRLLVLHDARAVPLLLSEYRSAPKRRREEIRDTLTSLLNRQITSDHVYPLQPQEAKTVCKSITDFLVVFTRSAPKSQDISETEADLLIAMMRFLSKYQEAAKGQAVLQTLTPAPTSPNLALVRETATLIEQPLIAGKRG
jgi:hypothetical protein